MTKEEELEYASKYKKTAKKLGVVISIIIIIFGLLIISTGVFIAIYKMELAIIIVGSIMAIAGLVDIIIGFRFKKYTDNRLKRITDKEASYRYCKIHGFKN